MNIFILNLDPTAAARDLCDKHVVKMVLETGQILSTVHHIYGSTDPAFYHPTHKNHPCVRWAAASKDNYRWLCRHFMELGWQYYHRYGRTHKTYEKLFLPAMKPPSGMPDVGRTPFALAMPNEYKCDDPVESYRNYYRHAKAHLLEYKHTPRPSWL